MKLPGVCIFLFLAIFAFKAHGQETFLMSVESLMEEEVFKSYDDAFANPVNVYVLDMSKQDIDLLSERICRTKNTQVLSLAENPRLDWEVAFSARYFGCLKKIQILDLQGNMLLEVPPGITSMKYITFLYLGDNQLKEIPKGIGNLKRLQLLSVHHNRLKTLPDTLRNCQDLETLDLSGNPTLDFNASLAPLTGLRRFKKLYLSDCKLEFPPLPLS
ncbi:MAG: hypothetical protein CVU06_14995, partial [Bacteroidetes bacterium HGW-Bacteroidetes-22]